MGAIIWSHESFLNFIFQEPCLMLECVKQGISNLIGNCKYYTTDNEFSPKGSDHGHVT